MKKLDEDKTLCGAHEKTKRCKLAKIIYIILVIFLITAAIFASKYFLKNNNITTITTKNNEDKIIPLEKELFYDISQESVFNLNVNKKYVSDGNILTFSKEMLGKIKEKPIELNQYYFANISRKCTRRIYKSLCNVIYI